MHLSPTDCSQSPVLYFLYTRSNSAELNSTRHIKYKQ